MSLTNLNPDGLVKVPLDARDGRKMSVTLQVIDENASRSKADTEALVQNKARKKDSEAEARAYLDKHRLHEFMHALFDLLLRERPEDPYKFIAARFQEAALLEPKTVPPALDKTDKVPRSFISAATTQAPTSKSEEETMDVPEGCMPIVVRSIRGRTLSKLIHKPEDTVRQVKEKLATALGVPVSSQQLLWWGEVLPNDTKLEEHHVPTAGASFHLAYGTRDPRLTLALSGSNEGGLRLWNLQNGELERDFNSGGSATVLAISVDWKRMRAIVGCFNGQIQLWDLQSGACLDSFEGHQEEVQCLAVNWADMQVLSGASDARAKLWQFPNEPKAPASSRRSKAGAPLDGALKHVLVAGSTVYTLAVDWAKAKACGGLRSGVVRLWDLRTG
eukprot:CAMPEP_0206429618 /NCGR_PEP_ID=MMETSP0324_2-20121206/6344_1 /ASSEMBLY_ACC=CAM_ASM_000836 /TAXON_ID=2866 /ORGANISM="Crypthecodinium cohnii, Strain Seligo" /LENGTH=388 /DNA_ID=CAMNT_0053895325 /DNA_START=118 /DNA_END=1280 /DNA_ORIENTATION=+